MTPGPACFDIIKEFEGCKLTGYLDAVGIPTIGWGHTSPSVVVGDTITQEQADNFLIKDVATTSVIIDHCINVPLTQPQYDAVTSFAYNVGPQKFSKSTMLVYINGGETQRAADEFTKWVNAGGKQLKGLVKRRTAERALFLTPVEDGNV